MDWFSKLSPIEQLAAFCFIGAKGSSFIALIGLIVSSNILATIGGVLWGGLLLTTALLASIAWSRKSEVRERDLYERLKAKYG